MRSSRPHLWPGQSKGKPKACWFRLWVKPLGVFLTQVNSRMLQFHRSTALESSHITIRSKAYGVPKVVGACRTTTAHTCNPACPLLFTRHLCVASGWSCWLHLVARYVCFQKLDNLLSRILLPVYQSNEI